MTLLDVIKYVRQVGVRHAFRTLRMTNELKIGALKGVDANGNRYFESLSEQAGRNRWVEYANPSYYDASQVTPEWHPWLHYMSDQTPDELHQAKHKWQLPHEDNKTFTKDAWYPPGHFLNEKDEVPRQYEPWQKEGSK
ncbi:NADH dehydrogenase [ubiquinone] 1 alpha subcomplex subunit 12 [Plasmodiophora brassicae]|uniref:NADH dehydrogenase [ubiquinone] 1 alpha subcomplex subunit 12 n=1 Tax=Plasmodiophora brassicae TaxID=37360 RepID=A0A0G4J4W0_PLABS|nr:hypothetical protein PBRA_002590 [Plasmodiophora brassicae]SPQ94752.1 unnamed protein product [Plasmodiophora brassicae]